MKIVVGVVAIVAFTTIFVLELVKKKGVFDKEIILSFLLVMGVVVYLAMEVYKNYEGLKKTN